MQLNASAIEQVTAATNIPLAITSLITLAFLWHRRSVHSLKACLWIGVFGSLTIAAGLGVIVHGLALDSEAKKLMWHPLNAALTLTVACFAAGAVLDQWGTRAARRTLPGWLLLSAGFFLYTTFLAESFLPFVIYEGTVMVFCLGVYAALAFHGRLAGAAWMLGGVAITILAAVLQAARLGTFTLVVEFDHNGVFHLIQLPGLICLLIGLRQNLKPGTKVLGAPSKL
jgi:hypothetical protein